MPTMLSERVSMIRGATRTLIPKDVGMNPKLVPSRPSKPRSGTPPKPSSSATPASCNASPHSQLPSRTTKPPPSQAPQDHSPPTTTNPWNQSSRPAEEEGNYTHGKNPRRLHRSVSYQDDLRRLKRWVWGYLTNREVVSNVPPSAAPLN